MLQLRDYQQRSLNALETYLTLTGQYGAKKAFVLQTGRPYTAVTQLPELPYICLRVPTGGGKTFMACHAVGIAAKGFLQAERATCLWLVPSNAIREQTLLALRDREHGYRQALDARFEGQVRVVDLKEALDIKRNVLQGETVIIVSTLAALRVEDPDGRKVYDTNGSLMDHFSGLSAELEAVLEKREDGTFPYSLANVLRMWRPLVIMDEAHNARTPLSFDTLQRFNPSCILEFTATPDALQNVLHHVSAAELKAEDMVKLPIKLWTHGDWKEVVAQAREMQQSLERAATEEQKETGEYVRPILLLQAQPKSKERQTLSVEVLKQSLIGDFKIPEDQIAVATGEVRGIDEINLFDPNCRIRFIITVQALKEGWDCSFAYVLCSVAETSSARAVEQILGRILRLPGTRRKHRPELNCAYAYVASPRFREAASSLKDALVENGFQKLEAADFVVPSESGQLFAEGTLFAQASECVIQKPDLSPLPAPLRAQVTFSENTSVLTVTGGLSHPDMETLQACFIIPEDRAAVERIYEKLLGHRVGPPPSKPERPPFKVPWLGIQVDGQLQILEDYHFKDVELRLVDWDAGLSEAEFPSEIPSGESGEVDIGESGKVEVHRFADQLHHQLALVTGERGWTAPALVDWLDRQSVHIDIPQAQSAAYIGRAIANLTETRGLSIEQLARQKFRLAKAVWTKIDQLRKTQAGEGYNALLFGPGSGKIEVSPKFCFEFDPERYAPNRYYDGTELRKHFFPRIGEMDGEEIECARFIDLQPQVWYWVRNLVRSESSFWLPTSTDRFYPDFVVLLNDGRVLLVEYKNERDWSNDDSKDKRRVGELWAERSGGRCLFVMPKGKDWQAINATVNKPLAQSNEKDKVLF